MDHCEDVWDNAYYQAMLAGAIKWTAGKTKADTTPDLLRAAPEANSRTPQ